jgi:hypothetical protein
MKYSSRFILIFLRLDIEILRADIWILEVVIETRGLSQSKLFPARSANRSWQPHREDCASSGLVISAAANEETGCADQRELYLHFHVVCHLGITSVPFVRQ